MTTNDGLLDFEHEESEDFDNTDQPDTSGTIDSYDDGDGEEVDLSAYLEEGDYFDEDEEGNDKSGETPEDQNTDTADQAPDDQGQDPQDFKNEENARNAERRRQQQAQELEQLRQRLPEYQLVKQLEQYMGVPFEEIQQRVQAANLQREAQLRGVTPEVIQREYEREARIQQLESQLNEYGFMMFEARIQNEMQQLKSELPMLTDADLLEAKRYLLNDLKNTEMPLAEAVYAKFGRKIVEGQREAARNEYLAQAAGRKSTTLPPKAGKSSAGDDQILTDAEIEAARALGIKPEDYLKYK
jgi:hypothetical protein